LITRSDVSIDPSRIHKISDNFTEEQYRKGSTVDDRPHKQSSYSLIDLKKDKEEPGFGYFDYQRNRGDSNGSAHSRGSLPGAERLRKSFHAKQKQKKDLSGYEGSLEKSKANTSVNTSRQSITN